MVRGKILPESARNQVNAAGESFNAWRDKISPSSDSDSEKGQPEWYQDKFDSRYFRRNDLSLAAESVCWLG